MLEEFKWFLDVSQLLRAIDFSDAEVDINATGTFVGPVQLNVGLGRAVLVGNIYLDEELAEEVESICKVEQTQQVDDLPELLTHSNLCIRRFAREKFERLLQEAVDMSSL